MIPFFAAGMALLMSASVDLSKETPCVRTIFEKVDYIVCRFDPKLDDIRLFHANDKGATYRHFNRLKSELVGEGETLIFAMNAGMYDRARNPMAMASRRRPIQIKDREIFIYSLTVFFMFLMREQQ